MSTRTPYPSDVNDEEWAFAAPYLTLLPEDASQRHYDLRDVFNGLRWMVRTGATWRMMPHDLPPWYIVYQQTQRWLEAGCFEAIVQDLRLLLRGIKGRKGQPSAAIFDSRVLHRRRKVVVMRVTMEPSAGRAVKCMWPSIRLGIC